MTTVIAWLSFTPPPERRAGKEAWRPPNLEPDRCARCGGLAMDHSTLLPEAR